MSPKTALIALHEPIVLKSIGRLFSALEYTVTTCATPEELKAVLGTQYDVYLIEANLGYPMSANTVACEEAWNAVQPVRGIFRAITATPAAAERTRAYGIPTVMKGIEFSDWTKSLRQP